jgi:hypothetical protein
MLIDHCAGGLAEATAAQGGMRPGQQLSSLNADARARGRRRRARAAGGPGSLHLGRRFQRDDLGRSGGPRPARSGPGEGSGGAGGEDAAEAGDHKRDAVCRRERCGAERPAADKAVLPGTVSALCWGGGMVLSWCSHGSCETAPAVVDFYKQLGFEPDPEGIRGMFWIPRY